MSFVAGLALLVGLLVVLPYVAHRLRRERADERKFAFTAFVEPLPPKARRRSVLEDRALFSVRALSVLAIAILAATPLVRCNRLALSRRDGASVGLAIVLDDSMSMRVKHGAGTRFSEAKQAALSLVRQAQEGDSMTLILAGAPARRVLAPTTDRGAMEQALEAAQESDRGTDLEGALALAKSSLAGLPQIDKRTLVFSDRADGNPEGPELGSDDESIAFLLPELAAEVADCAVLSASRQLLQVKAQLRCVGGGTLDGRSVQLKSGERVVATERAGTGSSAEVSLPLPADAANGDLEVVLDGKDALSADDHAPAQGGSGQALIGIVSTRRDDSLATGGAPVVERALAALRLPVELRPLPLLPDTPEDMASFAGLVLDDPPGLTPEERVALQRFLAEGRTLLLALGPRAHSAPLGASFEPVLAGKVTYKPASSVRGADPASLVGPLAGAKEGFADLGLNGRATLEARDVRDAEVLGRFTDGEPLLLRKTIGRGTAWVVTLPFSLDENDLALRPGFLDLLQEFAEGARERGSMHRTHPGHAWFIRGASSVRGTDPAGRPLTTRVDKGGVVIEPPLIGRYHVQVRSDGVDGVAGEQSESMTTLLDPRELDTRPRAAAAALERARQGASTPRIDVSWMVAMAVLGLLLVELILRLVLTRRAELDAAPASSRVQTSS